MGARTSIVVITYNRCEGLLGTLARLQVNQPDVPVIVVDNGSDDGTPARVAAVFPDVEIVTLGHNAGAAGRTAGARRARTPFVAFADDDSWWAAGSLERAERHFDATPRMGLLCGSVLVGPAGDLDPTSALMAASPLAPLGQVGPTVLGFIACAAVVRRDAYLAAGGFHPRFGVGGEETLLAIDLARHGWLCAYAEDVVSHHHPDGATPRPGRQRVVARNELWTAWLRRRPRVALARLVRAAVVARHDPVQRAALAEALQGLPWLLPQRRRTSPALERALVRLDQKGP